MSKKSRKRNKRILGALLLGGLGLGLANKGRGTGVSGSDKAKFTSNEAYSMPKNDMEFKETVVSTPKTIMDSMPARPKLNENSIRVKDGKVFTIKDAKKGIPPKRSGIDTPGIYVNKKGNITAGGKQFYDKNQYRTRNDKPGMLGDNYYKAPPVKSDLEQYFDNNPLSISAKKGGRIVKGKKTAVRTGAAKRGFGRAYLKGGKR
jgi:hypothetical protein